MHFELSDRVPVRMRLWSLGEDVLVEVGPGGDHLIAITQWGEVRIDDASSWVRESLQRLSFGPVWVENLPVQREGLRRVLERLGNCLVQSLGLDDETGPLLSVLPVSRQAKFWRPPEVEVDRPIRLSRFVGMRASHGELVLDSPVSRYRVALHRPLASWVVGSLCATTTIADLAGVLRMPRPVLADIVSYLVAGGMVVAGERGTPPQFAEDADPALIPWAQHDLLFHARSRLGRHNGPPDPSFPQLDRLPAAPVSRTPPVGSRFPLYRPPLATLATADRPLTEVIETSRSHRDYADREVTAEHLGELLFRAARIRWTRLVTAALGTSYVISDRPYPSTADLYELELYLTLDRCAGLPRGSYHYDPREHVLTLISDSEPELTDLLDSAKIAAGSTRRPPVLITVTSR
ncbi:MAG: hypothetical protein ACRDV2_13490, partial [Actinomycetes bacterium]